MNTWDSIADQFTIDGHKIVPGLRVWDYNYSDTMRDDEMSVVIAPEPYGNPAEPIWFQTETFDGRTGIFDGYRLSVARPW